MAHTSSVEEDRYLARVAIDCSCATDSVCPVHGDRRYPPHAHKPQSIGESGLPIFGLIFLCVALLFASAGFSETHSAWWHIGTVIFGVATATVCLVILGVVAQRQ